MSYDGLTYPTVYWIKGNYARNTGLLLASHGNSNFGCSEIVGGGSSRAHTAVENNLGRNGQGPEEFYSRNGYYSDKEGHV